MLKNKKLTKIQIISAVIILSMASLAAYYVYPRINDAKNDSSQSSNVSDSNTNLSPPTQEDAQRVEDTKKSIIDGQTQVTPTSGRQNTKPTITYADQYGEQVEVGALVANIFEDGGACIATFSKGSTSFEKKVTGIKGANSVNCPTIITPKTEFSATGTWSVVVSYSSLNAFGVSDSRQIEVK